MAEAPPSSHAKKPAGGLDWKSFTPEDSPKTPMDVMSDPEMVDLATPKLAVGDLAHEIDLPLCDFSEGVAEKTGERFRLSEAATTRPVALIFGSYT
jgi:hypothetical protein